MKIRLLLTLVLLAGGAAVHAQEIDTGLRFSNPAVRVLQSFTLDAGETVQQVVVIGGNATIKGRVTGDVVVILGEAHLSETAVIEGSFVVVGGSGVVAEGAKVNGDVFALGGFD